MGTLSVGPAVVEVAGDRPLMHGRAAAAAWPGLAGGAEEPVDCQPGLCGPRAAIEDCPYPDEALVVQQQREDEVLAVFAQASPYEELPVSLRFDVARTFVCLAQGLRLPLGADARAIALLDVAMARASVGCPGGPPCRAFNWEEALPAVCGSIFRLVVKAESSDDLRACRAVIVNATNYLSQRVWESTATQRRRSGLPYRRFTWEDLNRTELEVAKLLTFRLDVPTALSWIAVFAARLGAAVPGLLGDNVDWVLSQCTATARTVAANYSLRWVRQRRLVSGLICHGFAAARLVDAAHFRPKGGPATWRPLYARSEHGALECPLPEAVQLALLAILELALGADMEQLRQDALFAQLVVGGFDALGG